MFSRSHTQAALQTVVQIRIVMLAMATSRIAVSEHAVAILAAAALRLGALADSLRFDPSRGGVNLPLSSIEADRTG
jgi:hypothetical protein